jgi:hypothetical protein
MVVEGGFEPPKDGVQLIYSQSRLATSLFHRRNEGPKEGYFPTFAKRFFASEADQITPASRKL